MGIDLAADHDSTVIAYKNRHAGLKDWLTLCEPHFNQLMERIERVNEGREVCAKRARKLRKRGDIVSYCGQSPNGKARYRWIPFPTLFDPALFGAAII